MALAWADRTMVVSTTTGTGTLTLGSAITGYQDFTNIGNANTVNYTIEAVDSNGIPTGDWEVGQGTFTLSGTTLSRTTIYASSNGGSAVSFGAGNKRVFCSPPATWVNNNAELNLTNTFAPAVRQGADGVTSFLSIRTPADGGVTPITASTEAIGIQFGGNASAATVTRTWAAGALTTQREYVFVAPTLAFASATTVTTAITLEAASPIVGSNATLTNSHAARLKSSAAAHVPLVCQGFTAQTGRLQEWQNVSGTVLSGVDSGGNIRTSSSSAILIGSLTQALGSAHFLVVGVPATSSNSCNTQLTSTGAANKALICQGATTQSANIVEIQKSDGTILSRFGFDGSFATAPSVRTSGSPSVLTVTTPADTTLTASTESISVNLNCSATRQFSTGALTTQRECVIQAPTYAAVGATVITTAATLAITGAPVAGTNVTITNPYALWVQAGQSAFADGTGSRPGITFSSDPTIGFYRRTGGVVEFTYATVECIAFWGLSAPVGSIELANTGMFVWSGSAGVAALPDCGFARAAAGVITTNIGTFGAIGNAGPAKGWLQQSAGRARLVSSVTNVTTTLANLTELTITLIAGRKYTGRLCLYINNALAADGFQLDFAGTATMTSIEFGIASAVGATIGTRTSTALATPVTITVLPDTSDVIVEIPITMVVNGAGTLIPRQAKQADAAGATLTTRLGSFFWLDDMPA